MKLFDDKIQNTANSDKLISNIDTYKVDESINKTINTTNMPNKFSWQNIFKDFDYLKYVPDRKTNIQIAAVSTGGILLYTSYKYNFCSCQTYLTTIQTKVLSNYDIFMTKYIYKNEKLLETPLTTPIVCNNIPKLDIQESKVNPNPNGFQTRTNWNKRFVEPEQVIQYKDIIHYIQPNMLYSLIIGCNYSDTPYELTNCIDNTKLVHNMISEFKSSKLKCCKPIVKTDCKDNNVIDIMHNIKVLYDLCEDDDNVFIYYSGYCDKKTHKLTDITDEITDDTIIDKDGDKFEIPMTEEPIIKNTDILTVVCNDKEGIDAVNISINDICDIFVNPKIRLILCIDGFHYEKLEETEHMKENHLIIGSFVDENVSKTNNTTFTKDVYNYIQEKGRIDIDNELWDNLQVIGNKDILKSI